jgi:TrmH family RNA methyltransferase
MITSVQNPSIKRIRHLQSQARFRKKESRYVAEGIRLLEEALDTAHIPELVIYSSGLNQRGSELLERMRESNVPCQEVSWEVLQSASDTETPQGMIAVIPLSDLIIREDLDFVFIADQIRDPGNLGTLLRTARAAGVDAVLLTPGSVDPYSPKVIRSGMGAHFQLAIQTCSWDQIQSLTRDLRIFGADMKRGRKCWEADLTDPLGIILGGEAFGPGEEAREIIQEWLHIPMPGDTESLNVSIAGGILLFEVVRQRMRKD